MRYNQGTVQTYCVGWVFRGNAATSLLKNILSDLNQDIVFLDKFAQKLKAVLLTLTYA